MKKLLVGGSSFTDEFKYWHLTTGSEIMANSFKTTKQGIET